MEATTVLERRLREAARSVCFVITNDTEADDAWGHPDRLDLANMREVDRFQDLCEEWGVPPTYLVTYECATRDEAVRVLQPIVTRGACEIGHHLHSWSTPPFEREGPAGIDAAWLNAYQFELPDDLFAAKCRTLTAAIRDAYGVVPRVHRAGRWGVDGRTIRWLRDNDFVADTSVIPLRSFHRYRGRHLGGPSFYSESRHIGALGGLMEVPATVDVPPSRIARLCAGYLARDWPGAGVVSRLYGLRRVGGGRRLTLNPRYPATTLEAMIARNILDGVKVVNLALHSSELAQGTSPYSRTPADRERVWHNLERILRYANRIGLRGATLSQAVSAQGEEGGRMRREHRLGRLGRLAGAPVA